MISPPTTKLWKIFGNFSAFEGFVAAVTDTVVVVGAFLIVAWFYEVLVPAEGLAVFGAIVEDDVLIVCFAAFFFDDFVAFKILIAAAAAAAVTSFLIWGDYCIALCKLLAAVK